MSLPEQTSPFDPKLWRESRVPARPRHAFEAKDGESARRWQVEARQAFRERLALTPETPTPLNPQILDVAQGELFRGESVRFTSRRGLEIFGYFLAPNHCVEPRPALLCLHGHGYGVDALVGLGPDGQPAAPDYHYNFALQAVERGYAVLAIEILGFGRRREGRPSGPHDSSCHTLAATALMVGETLAGWRVYDAMRALDYLQSRPEVAPDRLGVMEISGGGLNALYLAAVDERVRATMVSGFLNTFRDSLIGISQSHCIDNFVPGLAADFEMSDIAGLVAPRALWGENGDTDHIFPVHAFQQTLERAREIYDVFGVAERCSGETFIGPHQFHGAGAWEFLEKNL